MDYNQYTYSTKNTLNSTVITKDSTHFSYLWFGMEFDQLVNTMLAFVDEVTTINHQTQPHFLNILESILSVWLQNHIISNKKIHFDQEFDSDHCKSSDQETLQITDTLILTFDSTQPDTLIHKRSRMS